MCLIPSTCVQSKTVKMANFMFCVFRHENIHGRGECIQHLEDKAEGHRSGSGSSWPVRLPGQAEVSDPRAFSQHATGHACPDFPAPLLLLQCLLALLPAPPCAPGPALVPLGVFAPLCVRSASRPGASFRPSECLVCLYSSQRSGPGQNRCQ